MALTSIINKVKIHVSNIAWSRSLKYTGFVLVGIIFRRIPFFDLSSLKHTKSEAHLERHMTPLHGGCFIDVGANYGMWTRFVAKQGVQVHAFEPSPRPYASLKKASLENVEVHNIALGDSEGVGTLLLHKNSGNDGFLKRETWFTGETVQTPIHTLDSFHLGNVGLIKIDTQGYEVPVIEGARDTITRCKPRIVVEVHGSLKEQISRIQLMLRDMGYEAKVVIKNGSTQPYIIGTPK